MPVVSNTSPISNLAIINRLELLHEQFGAVIIPGAVQSELARLPLPSALAHINGATADGWLRVVSLTTPVPGLLKDLDPGEAEALALALELKATRVLLDESLARRHADELGLPHVGILGVLRQAKRTGRIPSLAVEITRLRTEARFFISPALEKRLLVSMGEA
jgi:predicted nucleic acid-binding protein